LRHVGLNLYAFASNDKDAGDNMLELHSSSEDRNNFQLVFVKLDNTVLSDVQYELNRAKLQNLPPVVLKSNTVKNEQDTPVTVESQFQYSVSNTQQWGNTTTLDIGVEVTGNMGIPFVINGEIKVSASVSNSFQYGESHTETKTFTETIPITVPPKSMVTVDMICQQGHMEVPYTATATAHTDRGDIITIHMTDSFSGVSSYNVTTVFHQAVPITP